MMATAKNQNFYLLGGWKTGRGVFPGWGMSKFWLVGELPPTTE